MDIVQIINTQFALIGVTLAMLYIGIIASNNEED